MGSITFLMRFIDHKLKVKRMQVIPSVDFLPLFNKWLFALLCRLFTVSQIISSEYLTEYQHFNSLVPVGGLIALSFGFRVYIHT